MKCRTKFEEIKLGIKLAEQLPRLAAPDSLWREVESALKMPARVVSLKPPLSPRMKMAIAAAVLIVLGIGFVWLYNTRAPVGPTKASWLVTRLDGAPRIGSESISSRGRLSIGEWLETDGS
ncbi:MAG TPA: hypothetical protein VHH35_13930, partial [Pyrinomonadaceae bacterium]|nr:hypothetical protein [Pyrinomonadaceae bacterium]